MSALAPRYSQFAQRLRQLREEQNGGRGESQGEMADRLGITQPYVSQLHAGRARPGLPLIHRIAKEYGVDLQEWMALAGYSDEDPEEERLRRIVAEVTQTASAARVSPVFADVFRQLTSRHSTERLAEVLERSPGYLARVRAGEVPSEEDLVDWIPKLELSADDARRLTEAAGHPAWVPDRAFLIRSRDLFRAVTARFFGFNFLKQVGYVSSQEEPEGWLRLAQQRFDAATPQDVEHWLEVAEHQLTEDTRTGKLASSYTLVMPQEPGQPVRLVADTEYAETTQQFGPYTIELPEEFLAREFASLRKELLAELKREFIQRATDMARASGVGVTSRHLSDAAVELTFHPPRKIRARRGGGAVRSGDRVFWLEYGRRYQELQAAGLEMPPPSALGPNWDEMSPDRAREMVAELASLARPAKEV